MPSWHKPILRQDKILFHSYKLLFDILHGQMERTKEGYCAMERVSKESATGDLEALTLSAFLNRGSGPCQFRKMPYVQFLQRSRQSLKLFWTGTLQYFCSLHNKNNTRKPHEHSWMPTCILFKLLLFCYDQGCFRIAVKAFCNSSSKISPKQGLYACQKLPSPNQLIQRQMES